MEGVPAPQRIFFRLVQYFNIPATGKDIHRSPTPSPSQLDFAEYALAVLLSFARRPPPPPPPLQPIVTRGPSGVRALCSGCELGLFGGSRTPWMNGVCVCVCVCPSVCPNTILSSLQQSGLVTSVVLPPNLIHGGFQVFIELWVGSGRAVLLLSEI